MENDGFFTHYHMISSFSFEDWFEAAAENEDWDPSWTGEVNQSKGLLLERLDPMPFHFSAISSLRAFKGDHSLKMSCLNDQFETRSKLYKFHSDTKRNKRALGAGVTLGLAVFPEDVTSNATGVIEIILSLHEPSSGSIWEQYNIRYFLTRDSLMAPYREGSVYHVPVSFQPDEWNVLRLPVTEDRHHGLLVADRDRQQFVSDQSWR